MKDEARAREDALTQSSEAIMHESPRLSGASGGKSLRGYMPHPAEREERMLLAESSLKTIRHHRLRARMAAIEQEIPSADAARKAELYQQMQTIMQALEE